MLAPTFRAQCPKTFPMKNAPNWRASYAKLSRPTATRFRPAVRRWRELLAKLDPYGAAPEQPFPPPKPPGEPSRLRGKGRR
jgi:hypothetical protein